MSRSRSLPHSLVWRAKTVLMAADSHMNQEIAMQCVTSPAITHWKKRFVERGLAGLHDEARPGRPRAHDDEAVAELVANVLHKKAGRQRAGACVLLLRRRVFRRAQWPGRRHKFSGALAPADFRRKRATGVWGGCSNFANRYPPGTQMPGRVA
jgi:hypothetical protein